MPNRTTPAQALEIMTRLLRDLAQDHAADYPIARFQLLAAAEHVAIAAHHVADSEGLRIMAEIAQADYCPPQRGI